MKPEVLQSLLIARTLMNKAQELCIVEDKFAASSGLLVLQDAIELVLLACLIELGKDEEITLDNRGFPELIGDLRNCEIDGKKVRVPKSGTLKAMNKQRAIVKHNGQLAEPETVANYYQVASRAIDDVLTQVVDKSLQDVMLHELLMGGPAKEFLRAANQALEGGRYYSCLVEIRKAIFEEIESDYCIYDWRGRVGTYGLFTAITNKAPSYTKSYEWIERNVNDPFDYIQLDHEKISRDLLEWGASGHDFWNVWRLTPTVIKLEDSWHVKRELLYQRSAASRENARYCLNRAILLLSKKQRYELETRWIGPQLGKEWRVKLIRESELYEKANIGTRVVGVVEKGQIGLVRSIVPGLEGEGIYAMIRLPESAWRPSMIASSGYVDIGNCEIFETDDDS